VTPVLSVPPRPTSQPTEVVVYSGAGHAFMNDTPVDVYRPADTSDAWRTMVEFL
jgi:dienelactone hydrolase